MRQLLALSFALLLTGCGPSTDPGLTSSELANHAVEGKSRWQLSLQINGMDGYRNLRLMDLSTGVEVFRGEITLPVRRNQPLQVQLDAPSSQTTQVLDAHFQGDEGGVVGDCWTLVRVEYVDGPLDKELTCNTDQSIATSLAGLVDTTPTQRVDLAESLGRSLEHPVFRPLRAYLRAARTFVELNRTRIDAVHLTERHLFDSSLAAMQEAIRRSGHLSVDTLTNWSRHLPEQLSPILPLSRSSNSAPRLTDWTSPHPADQRVLRLLSGQDQFSFDEPLLRPTSVTHTESDKAVTIRWPAIPFASGYVITSQGAPVGISSDASVTVPIGTTQGVSIIPFVDDRELQPINAFQ